MLKEHLGDLQENGQRVTLETFKSLVEKVFCIIFCLLRIMSFACSSMTLVIYMFTFCFSYVVVDFAVNRRKKKSKQKARESYCILEKVFREAVVLADIGDCRHCGAKRFYAESSNFCCSSGQIRLYSHPMPESYGSCL